MTAENEQHENKESFYHLEICCRYVAEKYGSANIAAWTNGDYLKLSSILSRHTDVQISASTLKRIFGKLKTTGRYYPQKATRDALAHYAGFTDWEMFMQKHPRPVRQEETKVGTPVIPHTTASSKRVYKKSWRWPVIILLGLIITVLIWKFQQNDKAIFLHPGEAKLICSNPEGESPHSAVFKIQLPRSLVADTSKLTIDFGDGRPEKKVVPGPFITHYYEIPGRYYAVLKQDGLALDTVPIYLKTSGWTVTASMQHDTTRVYPVNSNNLFATGKMLVTPDQLLHAGVDTNRTFFVHFSNTRPLAINGDNFELKTTVTTSLPRPGVRCSQVKITVYGEKSEHTTIFIKPGCVSWALIRFSEIRKDGEADDLHALGTDLTKSGTIRLQVINKKIQLLVNEKIVYQATYHYSLGKIYGVDISFAGIGIVNSLSLRDLATGEHFSDGFIESAQ
ncbi:MAG: hypothetical protein V4450_13000 [Bacteroidota bacterium]